MGDRIRTADALVLKGGWILDAGFGVGAAAGAEANFLVNLTAGETSYFLAPEFQLQIAVGGGVSLQGGLGIVWNLPDNASFAGAAGGLDTTVMFFGGLNAGASKGFPTLGSPANTPAADLPGTVYAGPAFGPSAIADIALNMAYALEVSRDTTHGTRLFPGVVDAFKKLLPGWATP